LLEPQSSDEGDPNDRESIVEVRPERLRVDLGAKAPVRGGYHAQVDWPIEGRPDALDLAAPQPQLDPVRGRGRRRKQQQ
jgi:hypothetical protein